MTTATTNTNNTKNLPWFNRQIENVPTQMQRDLTFAQQQQIQQQQQLQFSFPSSFRTGDDVVSQQQAPATSAAATTVANVLRCDDSNGGADRRRAQPTPQLFDAAQHQHQQHQLMQQQQQSVVFAPATIGSVGSTTMDDDAPSKLRRVGSNSTRAAVVGHVRSASHGSSPSTHSPRHLIFDADDNNDFQIRSRIGRRR